MNKLEYVIFYFFSLLNPVKHIASGSEAHVYRLGDLIYKIYKKEGGAIKKEKLYKKLPAEFVVPYKVISPEIMR